MIATDASNRNSPSCGGSRPKQETLISKKCNRWRMPAHRGGLACARPRNRLPRQWFEQPGAGSRKGSKWRAAPTFVSIRRFDPTPSFRTTGPRGPVQPDHRPPIRVVFARFGRVVAVDRPQNRHGSTRLTDVNGGDPDGGNRRGLTASTEHNPLFDKGLRRLSAGRSAGIGPNRGENYRKLTRAGRLEGSARLSGQIGPNSGWSARLGCACCLDSARAGAKPVIAGAHLTAREITETCLP